MAIHSSTLAWKIPWTDDPEQVVLSACPLRQGEQCFPGTTHGWGQRGTPCSLQGRPAGRPDSAFQPRPVQPRASSLGRKEGTGPQGSGSAGRKKGQLPGRQA